MKRTAARRRAPVARIASAATAIAIVGFANLAVLAGGSALAGCGGAPGPAASTARSSSPEAEAPAAVASGPARPADAPAPATPADPSASGSAPGGASAWPFGPAPSADEKAAQVARLRKDPGPIRTNWTPPGKTDRYGHAETVLAAPYEQVRAVLADFAHYKDLAGPKFKKVNLADKQAGATDIYFQLPIMKGVITLWYVARFVPPRAVAGLGDVVEGQFVRGNIKNVHLVFTARATDDAPGSFVACDLLLTPTIPAPQGPLDEELRDACGDALVAVRARVVAR